MIVVRRGIPWVLSWILGMAVAPAALAADADPHELYQVASERLLNGDLKAAEVAAARLGDLVARHPEWDPDGVFAEELLPSMAARLRRLRLAARELEEFTDRALKDIRPPEMVEDPDAVRAYTDWATSAIDRLRRERDGLIAAGLPVPEDQAVLARTESYARSEQLLETDILRRMTDAFQKEVETLMPEGRRWQTMHDRLEQIKKGMMESVLDRDRLRRQLEILQARTKAYQGALIGLVLEGSGPVSDDGAPPAGELGSVFSDHLDHELQRVRSGASLSRAEYIARQESLERYRLYNRVLTGAGLIDDQAERIQALAAAVAETPLEGRSGVAAPGPGRAYGPLLAFLAAAVVGLGWMVTRRRRLAEARARTQRSDPGRVTEFPQGKDGTNAA